MGQRAVIIALVVVVAACSSVISPATPSPTPTAVPTTTPSVPATFVPTDSPSRTTPPPDPTIAPEPQVPPRFEYVQFLASDVPMRSQPSDGEIVERTHSGQVAAVLERVLLGSVEWIRVEVGSLRTDYRARYGWVPRAVDLDRGGRSERIDPVYEATTPACPGDNLTLSELAALLPALALECYAGETLTFLPVQLRFMYTSEGETIPARPTWLTFESFWAFEGEAGNLPTSMGMHIDAPFASVPTAQWVEIQGGFDHPSAGTCEVHGALPHGAVADGEDPVRWCRTKFVVSAVRVLPDAERPPDPLQPTPGPPATRTIPITTRAVSGPLKPRFFPSAVWTGSEVIIWGGSQRGGDRLLSDGAAYDPHTDRWRDIEPGPLTEREGHLATWTGHEMLVWGGRTLAYIEPPDGAAYDPQADRWREIAQAPLDWEFGAASAWTGSEWVIASTPRNDRTRFAAYDPARDVWRTLPSLDATDRGGGKSLAWTGSELVYQNHSGMLTRLPMNAGSWVPMTLPPEGLVNSPIIWSGEHLMVIAWQHVDHHLRQFLAAWDPSSETWLPIPKAPQYLSNRLVWAEGRALIVDSDLAYDVATQAWWELPLPDIQGDYGNVVVWAGDRLFIWGGGLGHGTVPNESGSVSIPNW